MNYIAILSIVARLASIADKKQREAQAQGKPSPTTDTLVYFSCRELCKQYESTNKNIAATAGYSSRISDIW